MHSVHDGSDGQPIVPVPARIQNQAWDPGRDAAADFRAATAAREFQDVRAATAASTRSGKLKTKNNSDQQTLK